MMRIPVCALALLLLLLPAAAAAHAAALDRGSLLVEGDASFASIGVEGADPRATSLLLRPAVKYFVLPGLAMGGEVLVGYSSRVDIHDTTLGVGPSVDYYFGALDASLHPFLSGTVFFGRNRSDRPTGEVVTRQLRLRGAAGLLYLFSEQAGVNGALFYEKADSEVEDITRSRNAYGLAFGISVFVF